MRSERGITLVSLVVTIIVLIILAGVSINLTLGENGIITMAKKARENMELAKVDEESQLNELYMQMEQEGLSGGISYDAIAKLTEFKREIASAITDMGINTDETADATTMSSNIRNISTNKDASSIIYDNSNSRLKSTNVQGAVDEINKNLTEVIDFTNEIIWNEELITPNSLACRLIKVGKCVEFSIFGVLNFENITSTAINLGTLPNEVKPNRLLSFSSHISNPATPYAMCNLLITEEGVIWMYYENEVTTHSQNATLRETMQYFIP